MMTLMIQKKREHFNFQPKEDRNNNNTNNNNSSSLKLDQRQDLKEERSSESPKITRRLENFIDEKCNMLSKSGVSKEGSVHLAQWIKGQFKNTDNIQEFDSDETKRDWSVEEVLKRSKELKLMHEVKKVDENPSEDEQQSTSKSTSGSQVSTLRRHPFVTKNPLI